MSVGELVQQLVDEAPQNSVLMMGEALLNSFGLDFDHPTVAPDPESGFDKAKGFLQRAYEHFEDPERLVEVAPFGHAYLGPEIFDRAANIIFDRAVAHENEQDILDEIITATCLLRPELRQDFLNKVEAAQTLDGSLRALNALVRRTDPDLQFSSTAQFPPEMNTTNVNEALHALGMYIELGLYVPAVGCTDEFRRVHARMKGFSYLFQEPTPGKVLVVANHPIKAKALDSQWTEHTRAYDARPRNSGMNPSVVLLNTPTALKDVQRFYPRSTIAYLALGEEQEQELRAAVNPALVVRRRTLEAHLKFIKRMRGKAILLDEMLDIEVERARRLVMQGNENFYPIEDAFRNMGRLHVIEEMLEEEGADPPPRGQEEFVMLLHGGELSGYLAGTDKSVLTYDELPSWDDTGTPFTIVCSLPIAQDEIQAEYPGSTVVYIAPNAEHAHDIRQVNGDVFMLEGDRSVGEKLVQTYFPHIEDARQEGITDMYALFGKLDGELDSQRNKILYSTHLRSFRLEAETLYGLQERKKNINGGTAPVILDKPEVGGCCAGGNLPKILITYAVSWRKEMGEDGFMDTLRSFHEGRSPDAWYMKTREYEQEFGDADMTF